MGATRLSLCESHSHSTIANLRRHARLLPRPFIFCNYENWGQEPRIMVLDRRRLEPVGGSSLRPSGLLSHTDPPDTRGREPARPTPGSFLPLSQASPPPSNRSSFFPKPVEGENAIICLVPGGISALTRSGLKIKGLSD